METGQVRGRRPGRLGAAFKHRLNIDYPVSFERERALLVEGRRHEALVALEHAREQTAASARRITAGELEYLGGEDPPPLERLAEIAALAREEASHAGWGSWQDNVDDFAALAAAAGEEVQEIRAELLAKLESQRAREQRRRLRKAIAFSVLAPPVVAGLVLPAGSGTSATLLALGLLVAFVLGLLAAAATRALWRRGVRSDLLYGPGWLGMVAGAVAAGIVAGA